MKLQKLLLSDILTHSTILSQFMSKVEQLSRLNRMVLKKLDPTVANHCRVSNLRDGILILTTHSPTWGHQLRFQETELLSALRAEPEWYALKSIQSRVIPKETCTQLSRHSALEALPKPTLSAVSATHIQSIALNITSPHLQQSLLRLAKRASFPTLKKED